MIPIIVTVPPLTVHILDKSKIPIAGQNQTIECEVAGSRPKPTITWWKDHNEMTGATIQVCIKLLEVSSRKLFKSHYTVFGGNLPRIYIANSIFGQISFNISK